MVAWERDERKAGGGGLAITVAASEPFRFSPLAGDRLISAGDFSGGTLRVEVSLLVPGDFARFADSINHCLIEDS